jgi:hypothetical protein
MDPRFNFGDKVFVPFDGGIGTILSRHVSVFGGYEYVVVSRHGRKAIHETNLESVSVLDLLTTIEDGWEPDGDGGSHASDHQV